MEAEPSIAEPPKRRRRWFQFSLRTLLLLTLICAVGCAVVARRISQKKREREAVEAIVKAGGGAKYDFEVARAEPAGPAWLREVLGSNFFSEVIEVNINVSDHRPDWLTRVGELTFRRADAHESVLSQLEYLPNVRTLFLEGNRVTNSELVHVAGLRELETINLSTTWITDAGLVHLRGLSRLSSLDLSFTGVTDAGLKNLCDFGQLRTLLLNDTKITDAGLEHLMQLPQLTQVWLQRTQVTDDGVTMLMRTLPNCVIVHPAAFKQLQKSLAPAANGQG